MRRGFVWGAVVAPAWHKVSTCWGKHAADSLKPGALVNRLFMKLRQAVRLHLRGILIAPPQRLGRVHRAGRRDESAARRGTYRRKIARFDVTEHPTAAWLSRQVTGAFP